MELIDTPNPNSKKIILNHDYEVAIYIEKGNSDTKGVAKDLIEVEGVMSIFTGPNFLTITKEETADWGSINKDILNKFDTI